jgi:hypothetical protein
MRLRRWGCTPDGNFLKRPAAITWWALTSGPRGARFHLHAFDLNLHATAVPTTAPDEFRWALCGQLSRNVVDKARQL